MNTKTVNDAGRAVTYTRAPYLTHRGCEVRETWVTMPNGVPGVHIELSSAGLTPAVHIQKRKPAA